MQAMGIVEEIFPSDQISAAMAAASDHSQQLTDRQAHMLQFVRMVRQMMADQLQVVVLNSIKAFLQLWQRYELTPGTPAAMAGQPATGQASCSRSHV